MRQLKESKATDTLDVLKNQFKENGYLFIPSFFSEETIKEIRTLVINTLEKEKWGQWNSGVFKPIEPVNRINSPRFFSCMTRLMGNEKIHEFSQSSRLSSFLSNLLGEKVFPHPRKMVRITYPFSMNPKDRIPAHQDIVYVKGERDTFTVWIPLGEYAPEAGGLEVAPGTHKNGLYPTEANEEGRFGCTALKDNLTNVSWRQAHYRLGDLLIMHSLLVHQSGVNEKDEFRLSLDCRFSSSQKTINEEQLLPPYYPNVLDWKLLSKGWENRERFEIPSSLKVHSKEKTLDQVLSTKSRFV